MLCTKTPTAFTKVATGAALSLALTAAACGDDESSSPSAAAGAAGMDSTFVSSTVVLTYRRSH